MKRSDLRADYDFLAHSLKSLAGEGIAKEGLSAVEEAFALAREAANADQAATADDVTTSITVEPSGGGNLGPITVFNKRQPVDAGPKKRQPVAAGPKPGCTAGGSCFSATVAGVTVTVCVSW